MNALPDAAAGKAFKVNPPEFGPKGAEATMVDALKAAPRLWDACWIWPDRETRKNAYYYFRKILELDKPPTGLHLHITADTRYQLYINGVFIGYGPPLSITYHYYYDSYEVGKHLQQGRNCIAVIVNQLGNTPEAKGGLLLEMNSHNGNTVLRTDTSWKAMRAGAWQEDTHYFRMSVYTPYQEFYDARQEPLGWLLADYNDYDWPNAFCLTGRISDRPPAVPPWTRLLPRDIPYMVERYVLPERVERLEETIDIINRMRPDDLSIGLSMVGQPLQHSRVEQAENLLGARGETVVQNSTLHRQRSFDGVYNPCIVLDFGRIINAFLELDLTGVGGGIVDIGYAERLSNGYFHNAIEGQFADRYTMKDGRQRFRPFTWKSFRYIKLMFRACFEPVQVHAVKAAVTAYPLEAQGTFNSSNDDLNAVFEICRYTIGLCSHESIMDTPWREQAQFTGDVAAVTLGGLYSCFGETRLPAKFLRQAAANQLPTGFLANVSNSMAVASNYDWKTVLVDYSLWWVQGLWNHYLYTGEEALLHHYYPHVLRILQGFLQYRMPSGLIGDMPYSIFIDWADVDRRGECATLNALFYGTLDAVAKMAALRQDDYTGELTQRSKEAIAASFAERLFNESRGCFVDANIAGVFSPKVSEHANMAAVLWGLCDKGLAEGIIDGFYVERSICYTEAQPFFGKVVLQALVKQGYSDLALGLIRERWGQRMVKRDATSTFEEWGIHGSWRSGDYQAIMRTQSHAWSAFPAEFLIRYLSGIEILEPGCRKLQVKPHLASFDYTSVFPTPLGKVIIHKRGDHVQIDAPRAIEVVPAGEAST